MGAAEVVWIGECFGPGMLGAVRIRQSDLDPRCLGQLESDWDSELGLCRRGICHQCVVSRQESLSAGQCDAGCEDE